MKTSFRKFKMTVLLTVIVILLAVNLSHARASWIKSAETNPSNSSQVVDIGK